MFSHHSKLDAEHHKLLRIFLLFILFHNDVQNQRGSKMYIWYNRRCWQWQYSNMYIRLL